MIYTPSGRQTCKSLLALMDQSIKFGPDMCEYIDPYIMYESFSKQSARISTPPANRSELVSAQSGTRNSLTWTTQVATVILLLILQRATGLDTHDEIY